MWNNISFLPKWKFTCSCWCCWGCFAPTGDETRNRWWNKAVALPSTKVACSTSGKLGGELKIRNGSLYQKLSDQIGSWNPLFPTCQVRVVRFYQRCSPHPPSPPPPPPPLPPPPVSPRPCLHQLPRPLPPCQLVANRVANFRAQWAPLDLNCRLPSPVGTAGPQPGTFRAQWAPLDLNLGPSELSGRPDRMPEDMPDRMSERMPEDIPDKMPEDMPDRMPEDMPDRMPEGMPDRMSDRMP